LKIEIAKLLQRAGKCLGCATVLASSVLLLGADRGAPIRSFESPVDVRLTADPESSFWKSTPGVMANHDNLGAPVEKNVMEVRSRWTKANLYVLFICDYDTVHLKPGGDPQHETFGLWDWDVAEIFIGDDFTNINRYKEFEVSPRGEWVDLDIDSKKMGGDSNAWRWNSNFKVKARIDEAKKFWYAEMCIPFASISHEQPRLNQHFRANFYRAAGQEPNRLLRTWRPTHAPTFHVPASFGILQLSALNEHASSPYE